MGDGFDSAVFDFGSGYTKTGYAGEDKPLSVFPTLIGTPKSSNFQLDSGEVAEHLLGAEALENYTKIFSSYPVERGVLINATDGEMLIDYCFAAIGADASTTGAVVTEPPLVSQSMREKMTEVVFETIECPAFFLMNQSAAALYSVARTSGVVVSCGDGLTTALPITEGFCCSHALYHSDFAGRDLTTDLMEIVFGKDKGSLKGKATFYDVEKMKEDLSFVSLNSVGEEKTEEKYTLPNGDIVSVGSVRYEVCERIFNPKFVGGKGRMSQFVKVKPLAEAVCESIATSEEEYAVREVFFSNILLTGGTSKLRGFHERFLQDIGDYSPEEVSIHLVEDEGDASHNAWIGGSIMASLSSTKNKFITKAEYFEQGVDRVTQKISLFG